MNRAPLNPAPSPFHFAYFFQNVCIGHGGLLPTIRAHQITRSGDAYAKPWPHPLVSNSVPGSLFLSERHWGGFPVVLSLDRYRLARAFALVAFPPVSVPPVTSDAWDRVTK